jgi:uncharacterized protein
MKTDTLYKSNLSTFVLVKQTLIECILCVAKPRYIFQLGVKQQETKLESIFNSKINSRHSIADVWLLILIDDLNDKTRNEWQDQIETRCNQITPTITIVVEACVFEQWKLNGDSFTGKVFQSAECLHGFSPESDILRTQPTEINLIELESFLTISINKSKEFLAGAELYRVRKQYSLSAFMLHQSAEQSLLALLNISSGLRLSSHNVERLIRYCSFLFPEFIELFRLHREEDKRLLRLLQKAYIDTRYKKDYSIRYDELMLLTEKVQQIINTVSGRGKEITKASALNVAI